MESAISGIHHLVNVWEWCSFLKVKSFLIGTTCRHRLQTKDFNYSRVSTKLRRHEQVSFKCHVRSCLVHGQMAIDMGLQICLALAKRSLCAKPSASNCRRNDETRFSGNARTAKRKAPFLD